MMHSLLMLSIRPMSKRKMDPPRVPSMHFDVSSLRRYRFCVGLCRNFGKCMEVIIKTGKTNTLGKTKTDKDKKVE